MINGNVLSQIDPGISGIHLFWTGPYSWIYSPGGWNIQRRPASRKPVQCGDIPDLITRLRTEREVRLPFGWLSYRTGHFDENTPAEIVQLDLDEPTTLVQVRLQVKLGLSFALYRGKVVAPVDPKRAGTFTSSFAAPAIDTVISYFLNPEVVNYCIAAASGSTDESWNNVPLLVKNLQLPIAELDSSLHSPAEEFEKAKSRLLPGEELDPEEFRQLVDILRPMVKKTGYPRHIDHVLLLREVETARFEELNATAPLLSLISHPKWRRVMGLGWFDQQDLLPGQAYEYRITGFFPLEDIHDRIYGFHTISSNTLLPTNFLLDDLLLQFSQPPKVELAPGTVLLGKHQLSRRGIALQVPDQFFWTFQAIKKWSVVLDFPHPVSKVQLELLAGHTLDYEAWNSATGLVTAQPVPAGNIVSIDFSVPISQLRIKGTGFLFTIRTKQALSGVNAVSLVMPPVLFASTPPPTIPAFFQAKNLQEIAAETSQESSIPTSATRSPLGFQVQWEASLQNGLTDWLADESTAPPLESTIYQIEHRQIPETTYKPILAEENWLLGHRRSSDGPAVIKQGVNLMQLFPERPLADGNTNQQMTWDDVFDFPVNDEPVVRPVPALGTTHQYRIRAIDIIGRPSINWRESNLIDLKKLIPPPQPVGPIPIVGDEPDFASPNGVHTRVLVRDAPDLTAEERLVLGSDQNVVILRWGWHKEQRELDPYTTEFRIYLSNKALDRIEGALVSVVPAGTGRFEGTFQLESAIKENAVQNSLIELGGYPFYVLSHEAGTLIKMIVDRRIPDENGQLSGPSLGAVSIPLLLGSDQLQPKEWSSRVAVVPLSEATAYSFEFRNSLLLSATQPRAEVWVGVSASDNQPYVDDKLAPAANRKGNESPIVPVNVQARFWGRPQFDIPAPLGVVPRLMTREPDQGTVHLDLDASHYLGPGVLSGVTHIRLERVSAGVVFNQYAVTIDGRIMATAPSPGHPPVDVSVPNPTDKQAIVDALRQVDARVLADRHLVFLAGVHPYRDQFFDAITPNPVNPGPITDRFPPQTNRYVYRIRTGNAAGLISAGDAMLKLVVRVPSVKPGPMPEHIPARTRVEAGSVQLAVAQDNSLSHVVLFYAPAAPEVSGQRVPAAPGSLLRVANRPDLYPDRLLRFRTPEGDFARQLIKELRDDDIAVDENGDWRVTFTLPETTDSQWRVWACSLTQDGIASAVAGPWRIAVPAAHA